MTEATIKVLFDNVTFLPNLVAGWGFSCLVVTKEDTILFDTGNDGDILLANMKKMGIDENSIAAVVISHEHWDHTGGLKKILEKKSNLDVFVPDSYSKRGEEEILQLGGNVTRVKEKLEIKDGIFSLGELLTPIPEQSLMVDIKEGMVIITGCAHPGIVEIVERAKNLFPEKKINFIMGGFHLKDEDILNISKIANELKGLGVKKIAPSHCTGEAALKYFREIFKDNYVESGVGKIFDL